MVGTTFPLKMLRQMDILCAQPGKAEVKRLFPAARDLAAAGSWVCQHSRQKLLLAYQSQGNCWQAALLLEGGDTNSAATAAGGGVSLWSAFCGVQGG